MSKANGNGRLIPAVGYLRKSTKGERADGRKKQEKSIAQQKTEIIKLASGRYKILKWFEDEGISGWKRESKRPSFQKMIAEVKDIGAQAIVCDNIDRFSRAAFDEVQEDVNALRKSGVRWIVTASHGEYDLGARFQIGDILKFAVSVWAACEFSRQLSRRVSLARRNAALEGKRSGGSAPYGLVNDGKGGLKHGDPKKAKVVIWMFEQFANRGRSLNWIAGDLNRRNVPGPTGGRWWIKTVAKLLRRRSYRGDFSFNVQRSGQFYGIDAKGEVVDIAELKEAPGKVFVAEGTYTPLVETATFDKAQRRLDLLKTDRSRRKRVGYTLTGILVCDHCGGPMYGTRQLRANGKYSPVFYRCGTYQEKGQGICGQYQVRENVILPFVLRTLGKEIADLKELLTLPPAELVAPGQQRREDRGSRQGEREALAQQIEKATNNILLVEDARTRRDLDRKLTALRDDLERMDAELAVASEPDYRKEELEALTAWWENFETVAVSVPVPSEKNIALAGGLMQDPFADESAILADPLKVNAALHQLGTEVRLRWQTKTTKTRSGGAMQRHELHRGRFRLGQQKGKLPRYVLDTSLP